MSISYRIYRKRREGHWENHYGNLTIPDSNFASFAHSAVNAFYSKDIQHRANQEAI